MMARSLGFCALLLLLPLEAIGKKPPLPLAGLPPVNVSLTSAIDRLQARIRQLKSQQQIEAEEAAAARKASNAICAFQILQAVNFLARSAFQIHGMAQSCPEAERELEAGVHFQTPEKACLISTASLITSMSQIAAGLSLAASTCAESMNINALCAVPIAALFTPLSQFIASSTAASASCAKEAARLPKDIELDRRLQVDDVQDLPEWEMEPEARRWQLGECVIDATSAVMAMGQVALGFNAATQSCPALRGEPIKEQVSKAACTVDVSVTMFSFARIVLFVALAVEHCAPGDQTDSLCVAACSSLTASAISVAFQGSAIYLNCQLGEQTQAILNGSWDTPPEEMRTLSKEKVLQDLYSSAGFSRRLSRRELIHELAKESGFKRPEDLWLSMGYNFSDPDAAWKREDPQAIGVMEEGYRMIKDMQTSRQEPSHEFLAQVLGEEPARSSVPDDLVDPADDDATLACSERDVIYSMDLPDHAVSLESGVAACQARCSRTAGCVKFSYWPPQRHCHVQGVLGRPLQGHSGWISGPPGCHSGQVSNATRLALARMETCYHPHAVYEPRDKLAPPRRAANVHDCQRRCQRQPGCVHFVFSELDGLCSFADGSAVKLQPVLFNVAGPRHCPGVAGSHFTPWQEFADRPVAEPHLVSLLWGALSALVGGALLLWAVLAASRRVYCRLVQGDQTTE